MSDYMMHSLHDRAAEARNRIRIMRLRYQANRGQEINHLISCQPTALKAVRLQALIPSKPDTFEDADSLEKLAVSFRIIFYRQVAILSISVAPSCRFLCRFHSLIDNPSWSYPLANSLKFSKGLLCWLRNISMKIELCPWILVHVTHQTVVLGYHILKSLQKCWNHADFGEKSAQFQIYSRLMSRPLSVYSGGVLGFKDITTPSLWIRYTYFIIIKCNV